MHLVDWVAKCIVVIIECSKKLSFAPSREDSDDLIITISLVMDLLMKYFGFRVCQPCVDLWSIIAVCTYKWHQQLK
uniref:Uncharacterized protein n=1 Tax=Setaria italica TaxID=4555 RepID=K3Y0K3_SETIT